MWLIQRLTPDFKTIADFRKNNAKGIKNACRTFIELCRQLNLFTDAVIAVDGSKFKAVNSISNNFTQTNTQRRIKITEQHIADYLSRLDTVDQNETTDAVPLKEKIALLKTHLAALKAINTKLHLGVEKQVSITDPDCRTMKPGSIGRTVGYNVQTAVDTRHHLIVAHYVTNDATDRNQLLKRRRDYLRKMISPTAQNVMFIFVRPTGRFLIVLTQPKKEKSFEVMFLLIHVKVVQSNQNAQPVMHIV